MSKEILRFLDWALGFLKISHLKDIFLFTKKPSSNHLEFFILCYKKTYGDYLIIKGSGLLSRSPGCKVKWRGKNR